MDSADLQRAVEALLGELDRRWGVEAAWLVESIVQTRLDDLRTFAATVAQRFSVA